MTILNVLIVEDDDDIAEFVRIALSVYPDLRVSVAPDSTKVLDQAVWVGIDVAVVDLMMPEVDGFEVVQWLRDNMPNTKTIIATAAHSKKADAERVADQVLLKPYTADQIAEAIRGVV